MKLKAQDTVDKQVDHFPLTMSTSLATKDAGELPSPGMVPSHETNTAASLNLATAPFSCHWTGCSAKSFARRSDLR